MVHSKAKGNRYERELAKKYKELGMKYCITSRNGSKHTDDSGVDLLNTGRLRIQAKNYKNTRTYRISNAIKDIATIKKLCKQKNIPGDIEVIHIRYTDERKAYIVMEQKDFLSLLADGHLLDDPEGSWV